MSKLEDIRAKIDEVDEQLAELFAERINLVKDVSKLKHEQDLPIEDLKREKEVLEKHSKRFGNPQEKAAYERFQRELIAISKDLQKL
ncbi:MAG: chorismate mutase [Bacteroidales bacterium]|nr:chorismate mutase [Bacteroidales bacterium]